uniref:chemokine-like factor isoform X2 n=1 Tax=Jaculus jaculus TaxID=51337 RepID=UPI001E1B244F|nr:chemokine-like factor isoform X2 [Jaculus jaculus]
MESSESESPFCFSLNCLLKTLRLDVINSMVATLFMIIVSILAMITDTKTYILLGGVCGLLAVVCTIADGALIYRKLRRRPSEPYEKDTSRDESEES